MPPDENSPFAVASFVCGLVGLIPCFWGFQLPGMLALIFGFIGMSQTKNNARGGRRKASAGLALGYFEVALWLILVSIFGTMFD